MAISRSSMPSSLASQFKTVQTLNNYSVTIWSGGTQTTAAAPAPAAVPQATPISPTFDPKIEANALYGKPMALFAGGLARIGASPAPIVGPYINSGMVDFAVSFGVAVPVTGNRKIYAIYLDNEKWWSSATGWDGSGALPGDSTFWAETADIAFRPGTLTQSVLSLETLKFPGDENAYRSQMLLQIRGLAYARFMANTGKPVPYVACDIGDVTGGANPADGINIGLALERIAHSPWAGYTSATFEAVDITDVVRSVLIKDNFTIVDLCRSVTRDYRNIDLLQSDKLRVKDRGSNVFPDFVFTRDSIIGGDDPIIVSRAGATTQRRERELYAIDPAQDYTSVPSLSKIPRDPFTISAAVGKESGTSALVMDADTRQALVTFAQWYEENARKKVSFNVRAIGFQIEPGDLFALPDMADGIDGEVFKATQTTHGANYEVEIEGEAILRCQSGYSAPSIAFQDIYQMEFLSGTGPFVYDSTVVDLGAAASDRVIVLTIGAIRSIPNGRTIQAVTINGVAATIHQHVLSNGVNPTSPGSVTGVVASAVVPTGTTGVTVLVQTDGLVSAMYFGVHRLSGLASTTPHDSAQDDSFGSNPGVTIDIPSGGMLIAGYVGCDAPGSVVWTGVNTVAYGEQIDGTGNGFWGAGASQDGMAGQTARPVSVSAPAVGAEAMVAVSFG